MAKYKIRSQPRVRGGRIPTSSALIPQIENEIQRIATRHRVSRSWVRAVLLAKALHIHHEGVVPYDA